MNILTDSLWYLDGHHQAFEDRSCNIPSDFQSFQGYNRPEGSKHRRRDVTNLSAGTLDAYSSSLNKLPLQPWFDLDRWKPMRRSVTKLADSMAKYAVYLRERSTAVEEYHTALTPTRSASDCESFCMIPKAVWVEPAITSRYKSLQDCINAAADFEPVLLNDYAPINTRYIQKSIMYMYT